MIRKMETSSDSIEVLLEKTGLSCEELLQKLLAYKTQKGENKSTNETSSNTTSETVKCDSSTIEQPTSTNEVENDDDARSETSSFGEAHLDFPEDEEPNNLENGVSAEKSDKNYAILLNFPSTSGTEKSSCSQNGALRESVEENQKITLENGEKSENIQKSETNADGSSGKLNDVEYFEISTKDSEENAVNNERVENCSVRKSTEERHKEVQKEDDIRNSLENISKENENKIIGNCPQFSIDEPPSMSAESVDKKVENGVIPAEDKEIQNSSQETNSNDDSKILLVNELKNLGELSNSDYTITEKNQEIESETKSIPISQRKKSICEELALRFLQNKNEESIDAEIDRKTPEETKIQNDIEICEVETAEQSAKPIFLKLRKDLFNKEIEKKEAKNKEEEKTNTISESVATNITENTNGLPKLRKIKVGYLKKKNSLDKKFQIVKQKTTKHYELSNDESTSPELTPEPETAKSQEEIRKNLKLQLSSLRNRKRLFNPIENATKKITSLDDKKINYKKQLLEKKKLQSASSCATTSNIPEGNSSIEETKKFTFDGEKIQNDSNCATTSTAPFIESTEQIDHQKLSLDEDKRIQSDLSCASTSNPQETEPIVEPPDISQDSLFSLTEETSFKILDVQGGVELCDEFECERVKEPSDTIKLTKTTDFTKIKGWKNKKFTLDSNKQTETETDADAANTRDVISEENSNSTEMMRMCENSNTELMKIGENSNEVLAPFVSNSLEEFLTENSTLNISYKVPKSGAEEGIKEQNYDKVVIPQFVQQPSSTYSEKKDKPKGMKAKTLAEKRRMLEAKMPKKEKKEYHGMSKTSYVMYDGRKLIIPSTKSNKCIAEIDAPKLRIKRRISSTNKLNESGDSPRKLSLLDLWNQKKAAVKYKAGPLCKKRLLQNCETMSTWDTSIVKLPVVKLEIVPEFKKPLPPHIIQQLPPFAPVIAETRLEFALTAVQQKSSDIQRKGYAFSIPYKNNQKNILVKSKKKFNKNIVCDVKPERNSIESIIDDLITYVEIKEFENSIIKDAEPMEVNECETAPKDVVSTETKSRKRKLDKLDYELLRLNCKVVNVSVKQTEDTNSNCKKPHCKLGCVCRSISCMQRIPSHCSNIDCMFKCKCPGRDGMSITEESPVLSSDAVNRIEDQAKKHLAKEEKEFTQTIIHADDKTILIPSSDRNKTKRTKRIPKRFSDFLKSYDEEHVENSIPQQPKPSPKKSNEIKDNLNCFVSLRRLNLDSVVPLCLVHKCYNCFCINRPKIRRRTISEDQNVPEEETYIPRKSKKRSFTAKPTEELVECEIRPKNQKNTQRLYSCARFIGVPAEVISRNKIPYFNNKLKQKIRSEDWYSLALNPINVEDDRFIDVLTPMKMSAVERLKIKIDGTKSQHKRKQVLEVRTDVENTQPKATSSKHRKIKDQEVSTTTEPDSPTCTSVFRGEILIPTNENREFVKKLGVKTFAPFMRLLPWNDLLNNYYHRRINIWCSIETNDKLLINTLDKQPPNGYIEIDKSVRKNGIMTWILTKKLPQQTPSNLVHLILSPSKEHFEISGICLKNISAKNAKNVGTKRFKPLDDECTTIIEDESPKKKSKTGHSDNDNTTANVNEISKEKLIPIFDEMNESGNSKESKLSETETDDPNFLAHRDHKNDLRILCMTSLHYTPRFFYLAPSCRSICDETFPIFVELPNFYPFRMRMMYLNSNFSYLSFINNKYSVKYTDLMQLVKKAQNSKKTIRLESKHMSKGYSVKNFGIYAVPNFRDRLFIGPYKFDEDHALETLRYLRQSLVSTSYFDSVQGGNPNVKKAVWVFSKKYPKISSPSSRSDSNSENSSPVKRSERKTSKDDSSSDATYAEITPITNMSSENKAQAAYLRKVNLHSKMLTQCDNFVSILELECRPFVKYPQFTLINGHRLKPGDYNRFIMTNIPHFGYLGAVQNERTKTILVSWPVANKILRFENVNVATSFLKGRFANMIVSVPSTFQIQLIILREIDFNIQSPMDPNLLSGTYLCGEFGVIDSKTLTPEVAHAIGTTREEIMKKMEIRAERLANFAANKLAEQEKYFITIKKDLIQRKQDNLTKFMELLKNLPEEERKKKYDEFRKEFNDRYGEKSSQDPNKKIECIEIPDSDSEPETEKNSTPQTPKASVTSPMKGLILKSILKPKATSPSNKESSKFTEGLKFAKGTNGQFVLMKDKNLMLSSHLNGMKMTIRNNRVLESSVVKNGEKDEDVEEMQVDSS